MRALRQTIASLQTEGWRMENHTLSGKETYLRGVLFSLPFLLLAGGMYRVYLLDRAILLDHTTMILLAAVAVSLPIHEALHGLGWKIMGRLEKGDICFFFRHGLPMCSCKAVLPARAYLTGVLLPFMVLGGGSVLFLIVYPGSVSLLTALVNLTLPGADLVIAYKILRSDAVLVADSPDSAGFVGLCR